MGSKLSVTKHDGFKRVEVSPVAFRKKLSQVGNPRFGSSCVLSDSISSGLHVVEIRPLQQRQECFLDLMDSHVELCFPTFFSNRWGFKENGNR